MVVWVEIFGFPFVVAACTLVTRFAAARPVLGVGKVGLFLPRLFVGVQLEFVWIGVFKVGVLSRKLVGLVGLDRRAIDTLVQSFGCFPFHGCPLCYWALCLSGC